MSDSIEVALIAGLVAIASAIIAAWQASRARRVSRTGQLEERVSELETQDRLMWLWARSLVDHIYRGDDPPPPEPPPGLFDTRDLHTKGRHA